LDIVMEKREFGPTGQSIAVVGQGTWQVLENEQVIHTLERGIELGMTHIDTAELYMGAEGLVRQAVQGRRDALYLVSKVMPNHASRRGTVHACEQSLRRLGTEYLDCYLLHWDGGEFPIEETMAGMQDLVAAGKIRSVGVSNFDVLQMKVAAAALGDIPLACNQVIYHLGSRAIEREVLPWCEENNVALVGYSPFACGNFFDPGTPEWETLSAIAARHRRTIRQVVLRFLTRRPLLFAIPKASTIPHVEENAGGQGFTLSAEDLGDIEAAFPV
jgi:diketogulonate reductase-like aldo/keto reductase